MAATHTAIEFQKSSCRIFVWESAKGRHTLTRLLRVRFDEPSQEEPGAASDSHTAQTRGAAIRQALKTAGLSVKEVLVILPKEWVTLRIVKLPSSKRDELGEMARFEAERHIPFNTERHIISHHVLRVDEIQGSDLLLAALDGPPAEQTTSEPLLFMANAPVSPIRRRACIWLCSWRFSPMPRAKAPCVRLVPATNRLVTTNVMDSPWCRKGKPNRGRLSRAILTRPTRRASGFASSFSVGVTSHVERKSIPRAKTIAATSAQVKGSPGLGTSNSSDRSRRNSFMGRG